MPDPTTSSGSLKTELGIPAGVGVFTSNLTGLEPKTKYYVKAYCSCGTETAYGGEINFTTGATPPTATVADATLITNSTATLNGAVNANGDSTTVTFEYGITTSYGSIATATPNTVTGTSTTNITATLTGLTSGTLYHFRVKAVNAGGTVYSGDLTFSTLCVAPTATTNSATNISTTTAILNGSVNANGCSTTVTFDYGLTSSYGLTMTAIQSPVSGTTLTSVSVDISGLTSGKTYHYRVKAVSDGMTDYGVDLTFMTQVTDIDGNAYNTVIIGTQVWLVENLKTTKYRNGDFISYVTDGTTWGNATIGSFCWYNNNAATYKNIYGALYNWYAVNDSRKICPTGWHVPSFGEWATLYDFVGGNAGKLKEAGIVHWKSPNTGATDETNFTALPGGFRSDAFKEIGNWGMWWSTTGVELPPMSFCIIMFYDNQTFMYFQYPQLFGLSVRCLKD